MEQFLSTLENWQVNPGENKGLLLWIGPILLVWMLLLFYFSVTQVHQRNFWTYISPNGQVSAQRFGQGCAVWLGLSLLRLGIDFLLPIRTYTWTFDPLSWLQDIIPFLAIAFLTALFTELVFHAYILQHLGLLIKNKWVLMLVVGLFPGVLQIFNRATITQPNLILFYTLSLSVFWVFIILKDNRLELAISYQFINMIYVNLIVGYENSPFSSFLLISPITDSPGEVFRLVLMLLQMGAFYALFFSSYSPTFLQLPKPQKIEDESVS